MIAGFVTVSIPTLNSLASSTSKLGHLLTSFDIGSEAAPVPVKYYLEPITYALENRFWTSVIEQITTVPLFQDMEYLMLRERRDHLLVIRDRYAGSIGSRQGGNHKLHMI